MKEDLIVVQYCIVLLLYCIVLLLYCPTSYSTCTVYVGEEKKWELCTVLFLAYCIPGIFGDRFNLAKDTCTYVP